MLDHVSPILLYPIMVVAIGVALLFAVGAVYIAVRVGSIAHFRTKAEYDRGFNHFYKEVLNGEDDAKE